MKPLFCSSAPCRSPVSKTASSSTTAILILYSRSNPVSWPAWPPLRSTPGTIYQTSIQLYQHCTRSQPPPHRSGIGKPSGSDHRQSRPEPPTSRRVTCSARSSSGLPLRPPLSSPCRPRSCGGRATVVLVAITASTCRRRKIPASRTRLSSPRSGGQLDRNGFAHTKFRGQTARVRGTKPPPGSATGLRVAIPAAQGYSARTD